MKLSKSEQAWLEKRKKPNNYKEIKPFKERLKEAKSYPAFSPERYEAEEKLYKKYGRSWHIFHDVKNIRSQSKYPNWMFQFRKETEQDATHDI